MLYVKADFEKSGKSNWSCTTIEVTAGPTSVRVLPHLTLRVCLSLHSRPFDALGFILPTRMIGNILFRNTLQLMKKEKKGKIPWDDVITGELKEKWQEYFSMLNQLESFSSLEVLNLHWLIQPLDQTYAPSMMATRMLMVQ